MSVSSRVIKRAVAAVELLLISPAALFMTALFVREIQPPQFEPAHTAGRIVAWYAARPRVGLWVFLMALPFAALVTGGATLVRNWRADGALRDAARLTLGAVRPHLATLLVALATVTAAAVLAIVAVHVLTD